MSRIDILPKMWQRPAMYLFDYVQTDSASMVAEFIHAAYQMSGSTRPSKAVFQSQGEYHVMIAEGLRIQLNQIGMADIPLDLEGEPSLIDWLSNRAIALAKTPSKRLQLCIGLANIISFTEFCALDMTVGSEHFRQSFYHGQAVSPYERRKESDLPIAAPYVGLWFTLHPRVFQSRTIKLELVKQALDRLQKYILQEFQVASQPLHHHGFEMTIEARKNVPTLSLSETSKHVSNRVLVPALAS